MGSISMKGYRPFKIKLAQSPLVDLRPNINVESPKIAPVLNIELGGLPISLGLFAGSALAFYVKSQVKSDWQKTAALVAGAFLAIGGILNLVLPKLSAAAQAPAPPAGTAPSAAPVAPGGAASAAGSYTAPAPDAFGSITGRIVQPADFSTVDLWPWSSTYPVRIQLMNGSQAPATFELELTAEEDPAPIGAKAFSTLPVQVSLNPGEVKDIDVNMPIASWTSTADYVDVLITAKKRRAPGEAAQLIDMRSFVVE